MPERFETFERRARLDVGADEAIRWHGRPGAFERRDYVEGRQFRDVQIAGPFGHWSHTHSFEPAGPDASVLVDRIEYALPRVPLMARLAGAGSGGGSTGCSSIVTGRRRTISLPTGGVP